MNHEVDHKRTESSTQALRQFINRQSSSVTILAALGAVLDAQVSGRPIDPVLQVRLDEMMNTLGVGDLLEGLRLEDLEPILAEIRFNMLLETKLLFQTRRTLAWEHTETELLQAGGEVSVGFAQRLTTVVVPHLEGLSQRLGSADGAFLDVGVGIAGLSIAMARLWPVLNVVGIDPWEPSLTLARQNVDNAGLTNRIQLREQSVEDLHDTDAFDLAWIPSAFIPEKVLAVACERVYRALRPGGWLLFAMANPGNEPLSASLVRLRTVLRGGCVLVPEQVEALLRQSGFADVRTLPSPPDAIIALVAARRTLAQRAV